MAPFQALFGTLPRTEIRHEAEPSHTEQITLSNLHQVISLYQERAQKYSVEAHEVLAAKAATTPIPVTASYSPGDLVMVYDQARDTKLRPRWKPGYTVIRQDSPRILRIKDVEGKQRKAQIGAVHRYNKTRFGLQEIISALLPPKTYLVEQIVDHKYSDKGELQLLVRWLNYDSSEDTWQPYITVRQVDVVKEYINRLKLPITLKPASQTSSRRGNVSLSTS